MKTCVIGLCDDKLAAIRQLETIIMAYVEVHRENVEIREFQSGAELLAQVEEVDILFLDIDMPQMDGIEVGRQVCKKNFNCKMIMATGCQERFKDAFKINAFRFVSKPFLAKEVEEALEDAIGARIGTEKVTLYYQRVPQEVYQRDIVIVKAYNGYVEATVKKQSMRRDVSLRKMETLLDKRLFYKVDRQYLINLLHIESYENGSIKVGGCVFKVARRKRKDFEAYFQTFDVQYRG